MMASSPEQEISQEIVEAVGIEYLLRMPVGSSIKKEPLRAALAAVLPDLQRPLLEEIERERETRKALAQIADERKTERDAYIKELGEVNVERQRQEVRAIEAERERDARPDLTRENILTLMKLVPSVATIPEREAYAKLERSLNAAG